MDNQSHLPQHHLQDSYSHYPPRSFHAHEPKKKLFGRTNSISRRPGYIRGESGKSPAHPVYAVGGCTCALLALNRARILRDMKMRCHLPKRIIRLSRVHADDTSGIRHTMRSRLNSTTSDSTGWFRFLPRFFSFSWDVGIVDYSFNII